MYKLPGYVGIILKKNNHVLLVKRHNTDWASGYWNFPGGLLEEGETLVNAAAREAHEEVGVTIAPNDLELAHVIHVQKGEQSPRDIFGFYFMAQKWHGTPTNKEPDRHSEIGWFDLDNLPDKLTEHALQAIHGLTTNKKYSES